MHGEYRFLTEGRVPVETFPGTNSNRGAAGVRTPQGRALSTAGMPACVLIYEQMIAEK